MAHMAMEVGNIRRNHSSSFRYPIAELIVNPNIMEYITSDIVLLIIRGPGVW